MARKLPPLLVFPGAHHFSRLAGRTDAHRHGWTAIDEICARFVLFRFGAICCADGRCSPCPDRCGRGRIPGWRLGGRGWRFWAPSSRAALFVDVQGYRRMAADFADPRARGRLRPIVTSATVLARCTGLTFSAAFFAANIPIRHLLAFFCDAANANGLLLPERGPFHGHRTIGLFLNSSTSPVSPGALVLLLETSCWRPAPQVPVPFERPAPTPRFWIEAEGNHARTLQGRRKLAFRTPQAREQPST